MSSIATRKSGWVQAATKGTQLLEFSLVALMLLMLGLLVVWVMWAPVKGAGLSADKILEYRSGILTTLLTAFGAWIGAGAAYFFGSKSLQRTTDALITAQSRSSDRLAGLRVGDLRPVPLGWKATLETTVEELVSQLRGAEPWWFLVVESDGSMKTVIHEEVAFRYAEYLLTVKPTGKTPAAATVRDLIAWAETQADMAGTLKDIAIKTRMDANAQVVDELMIEKGVHVAIITDAIGRPTHSISEGDIKRELELL